MIVVVEDMLEEVVPQVVEKVDHLISSSMTMASWTCTVRGKRQWQAGKSDHGILPSRNPNGPKSSVAYEPASCLLYPSKDFPFISIAIHGIQKNSDSPLAYARICTE